MDAEFKQHHQAVIDTTEDDKEKLLEEQVILDEHNKVSDFMDCLISLLENVKSKEKGKPMPVPVKPEAPEEVIRKPSLHPKGYEVIQ